MRCRKCPTEKGFVMKSMAPSRMACTAVWMSLLPVMTMTSGASASASSTSWRARPVGKVHVDEQDVVARPRHELAGLRHGTRPRRSRIPGSSASPVTSDCTVPSSSRTRIRGGRAGAGTSSPIPLRHGSPPALRDASPACISRPRLPVMGMRLQPLQPERGPARPRRASCAPRAGSGFRGASSEV